MLSLKVCKHRIEKVKDALRKAKEEKGWQRDDFRWLSEASKLLGRDFEQTGYLAEGISSKTWNNFLKKIRIRAKAFQTYCAVLNLDWKQIYDSSDLEEIGLIITPDSSPDFLFEKAEHMYSKGIVSGAYELFSQLYNQRSRYQNYLNLDCWGRFYLSFGTVQMQRGYLYSDSGAFNLASKSLTIFSELGNSLKIAETYNLLGICFRQIDNFKKAIESYNKAIDIVKNNEKFVYKKMHIFHDLAVSSFLFAKQINSKNYLELSNKLFDESNSFFASEEPDFYKIATIRTAEMQIKAGKASLARNTLDAFEDIRNYSALILPFQALFLRINAEKYLELEDIEEGIKFFISALKLNQREGYTHQLKELEKLQLRYQDKLNDLLIEDFNVYTSDIL